MHVIKGIRRNTVGMGFKGLICFYLSIKFYNFLIYYLLLSYERLILQRLKVYLKLYRPKIKFSVKIIEKHRPKERVS